MNKLMRLLIKGLLILFSVTTFFSCAVRRPIERIAPHNNPAYQVEYLFEHDGCKVYRFRDDGHYVYFTNCKGDATSMENDSTATRITNRTIR
jgi:hypothetical protein